MKRHQVQQAFNVTIEWDAEASVWYVDDSDVPGLVAEASTIEAMRDKLSVLVPELVALNRHKIDYVPGDDLPVRIQAKRLEHFRSAIV